MYIGGTARTIWDRTSEHFQKMENRDKDNPLFKHWKNFHQEKETPPKFIVSKLGNYSSATERQLAEALAIERGEYNNLLNSKAEWGRNRIPRQVLQADENDPTPATESQIGSSDTHQKGQKRGAPIGDQNLLQEAPGSSTDVCKDHLFENQYSQRRKRLRRERKQEMENLSADLKTEPGISNQDGKRRAQLANIQTNPGRDGLKWVNGRQEQVKAMAKAKQHKAQNL